MTQPYTITILSNHDRVSKLLLGFGRELEPNMWECFISEFEASNMVALHGDALRFEVDGVEVHPVPTERRKRLPSEAVKPELNKEHQKTRYKKLNDYAKENGFTSWSALVTALLNGDVKLI